jgi:histidinol-phosphate aminotransferase
MAGFGPSPAALAMLTTPPDLTAAPDPDSRLLRQALAEHYRLPPEAFVVGPGVASLLHGTVSRAAAAGNHVVYSVPSFHLYQLLATAYRQPATAVALNNYHHDLPGLAAAVRDRAGLVLLDSPHNVTGTTVPVAEVLTLAGTAAPGTLVVYDNVYGEYQDPSIEPDLRRVVESGLPVIVARSFSKAHRLFGLRVGYLIAAPDVLRQHGPLVLRYDVGTLSQHAARAAIRDPDTVRANQRLVADTRRRLYRLLEQAGLGYLRSQSASVLIDVRHHDVETLCEALQDAGCTVRGPQRHGIAGHVQILIENDQTADQAGRALANVRSSTWTSS